MRRMVSSPVCNTLVSYPISKRKKKYHVRSCWGVQSNPQKGAEYVLACLASRENGFGHPSGVAQPIHS